MSDTVVEFAIFVDPFVVSIHIYFKWFQIVSANNHFWQCCHSRRVLLVRESVFFLCLV